MNTHYLVSKELLEQENNPFLNTLAKLMDEVRNDKKVLDTSVEQVAYLLALLITISIAKDWKDDMPATDEERRIVAHEMVEQAVAPSVRTYIQLLLKNCDAGLGEVSC